VKQDRLPFRIEWHELGCECPACEPDVPSVDRPLSVNAVAGYMLAGAAFGNLVAFAVDPSGSARELVGALANLVGLR
jgi:hypothetical protein